MATKDNCPLLFKDKQNYVNENGRFNNFTLNNNNNHQVSSNAFSGCSKIVTTERIKFLDYDFVKNSQTKKGSHSWNKLTKDLSPFVVNNSSGKEKGLKDGKALSASTLSLYIETYENSNEANFSDVTKEDLKKNDLIKNGLNAKQIYFDSTTVIQNAFEFPRQQDAAVTPEIAQYRASQQLLNPNQMHQANHQKPLSPGGSNGPRAMINEWMDIRCGDPFPTRRLVKALGKTLDTVPGQNPDQYVALWYQQGEPIMGRVWNEDGKVAANFGWFNREYMGDVGSIQILVELSALVRGFDYAWKPFKEIADFGDKEWFPVYVGYSKGDISPCVLTVEDGKQILGKVDVRNERATVAYNAKEHIFEGPVVHPFQVLCRRERDDTQVI